MGQGRKLFGCRRFRGLRLSKIVWNENTLDRWLTDPQAFVPGAAMFFRLDDPSERADVIAYLMTLK